jgi:hypothetical protein
MLWKQDVVTDCEPSTRKLEPTVKILKQAKGQSFFVTHSMKCYQGKGQHWREVYTYKCIKKSLCRSFLVSEQVSQ